jgi:CBS domain-containing protein
LVKVRDVMTRNVPHIDVSASVLDASKVVNRGHKRWSGVVVFQSGRPVGMLTDRVLLRRFIDLNKKPGDVKVHEIMAPLLKISADASISDAVKKMLQHGYTRLAVFDGEKLSGWVTITDIARQSSKQSIIDVLLRQDRSAADDEMLCPSCRRGIMEKSTLGDGRILRWECPNCHYEE